MLRPWSERAPCCPPRHSAELCRVLHAPPVHWIRRSPDASLHSEAESRAPASQRKRSFDRPSSSQGGHWHRECCRQERGVPRMATDVTDCQFARESSTVAASLRRAVGPHRLSSTRQKSTECHGWQQGWRLVPRSRSLNCSGIRTERVARARESPVARTGRRLGLTRRTRRASTSPQRRPSVFPSDEERATIRHPTGVPETSSETVLSSWRSIARATAPSSASASRATRTGPRGDPPRRLKRT